MVHIVPDSGPLWYSLVRADTDAGRPEPEGGKRRTAATIDAVPRTVKRRQEGCLYSPLRPAGTRTGAIAACRQASRAVRRFSRILPPSAGSGRSADRTGSTTASWPGYSHPAHVRPPHDRAASRRLRSPAADG